MSPKGKWTSRFLLLYLNYSIILLSFNKKNMDLHLTDKVFTSTWSPTMSKDFQKAYTYILLANYILK